LTPLILLLLLLVVIILLLFFGIKGIWDKKGSGGQGGNGIGIDTSAADSRHTDDSLGLDDSLRLARLADSIRQAYLDDSIRQARLDDSLRLAHLADSIRKAMSRQGSSKDDYLRSKEDSISFAKAKHIDDSIQQARARWIADSIQQARARWIADSIRQAITDSIRIADSIRHAYLDDSLRQARLADSVAKLAVDTAALRAAACARDTVVPWVYADPSGGLHRKPVSVKLVANKSCKVEWSLDGVKDWKVYSGKPIDISKPTTIYYKAVDNCGRVMNIKSKRYEFDMASSRCPAGMEPVKAGGADICVDVYEWPNKKGAAPTSYVSLYQAMDSCFSARKRLCTSDEWTSACAGPERWKYTYGEVYEWNTCATRDSMAQRSGSRPECRGYYGVFDMSGNLAEWTSTAAPQDKSFNNVMGGFWTSGNQSRCADSRYSYFPQNKHNPVGFRCCTDAPPAAGGGR